MHYHIEKIAGVNCLFAPMEESNSVTIEIKVKAGSLYETRTTNGISHFLEHLFFKGGKKYPNAHAVAAAVDKFGGDFNAYTGDEMAGYYVKCAPEFVHQAIEVLGDMMIHAQFPLAELEKEKGVVIQELKMYEDNPMSLVFQKWQEFYYGDNPYGWPIIGTIENISSFTQEMLFEHKNNLYSKDNLLIVIAGKISDPDAIKEQIAQVFASLPAEKKTDTLIYSPYLPVQQYAFWDKGTEQNHLIISAKGFDGEDDRRYAANVLATILGGNMSSRLFQNIRAKHGLCYYISAGHGASQDFGTFSIRAGVEKEKFDFALGKILAEIEQIALGNFSAEEFENAIGYKVGNIQMGIESSDEMASFLGNQYLIYGKIRSLSDILASYKKLTLEEVQKVASALLHDQLYRYWIQ